MLWSRDLEFGQEKYLPFLLGTVCMPFAISLLIGPYLAKLQAFEKLQFAHDKWGLAV